MQRRDPFQAVNNRCFARLCLALTFSINFLAIGWNSSFDRAKYSLARAALTLLAARNVGRQNFMRPLITPVPSRPVTHLSAWSVKSSAADDVGSLSATL